MNKTDEYNKDLGGVKADQGKPRFDLIPAESLRAVAEIFEMGARKYADRNWERGMRWGRVYAAMQRHLNAFWAGEELDSESGMHHLDHAAFGILVLSAYVKGPYKAWDDRAQHFRALKAEEIARGPK